MVATWLFHQYGTTLAVSIYLAILGSIAAISAVFLPDRYRQNYHSTTQVELKDGPISVPQAAPAE